MITNEIINKLSCEIIYSGSMNITNDGTYACAEGLKIMGVGGILISFVFAALVGLFYNWRKSK